MSQQLLSEPILLAKYVYEYKDFLVHLNELAHRSKSNVNQYNFMAVIE